jgi:hypothetical protein
VINKKALKKYASKCFFCPVSNYELLDVHRIYDGQYGGTYEPINSLICCANCHRAIHANIFQVIKKHKSYGENLFLVEVIENNKTKFLPCNY